MNPRPAPFFLFAAFILALVSLPSVAHASPQTERTAAAYLIALGRAPSASELDRWSNQEKLTVGKLVAQLAQNLSQDAAQQHAVRAKAFKDAYGRTPSDTELAASAKSGATTYSALMQHHLDQLAQNRDAYEDVLDRAYQLVVQRGVYPEEIAYWKKHDTLSFALLVGCVEDWARRNQPGLMVTAGTPTVSINSGFLTTVRVSRPIAEEARAAIGLPGANTDYYSYGSSRTVIASGAGNLVAGGPIHFVASGADNLVPTRAKG